MMKWHRLPVIVAILLAPQTATAQTPAPTVFVGPQIRDGFIDMDSGIRDSIRDIKPQIQGSPFRLAATREETTLSLTVIARGLVTNGSVGFASAPLGFGIVVPNDKPTLTTVLKVASYQRLFQSEGDTWTGAADRVVKDLVAWWEANREILMSKQ